MTAKTNRAILTIPAIKVTIPIKPLSVNDAWQGRRYSTPEKKHFEAAVMLLLPDRELIKGRVEIYYKFHLKNHALCDYDNQIKVIQDCLTRANYFEDDRKIYKATIEKIPAKEDKIEITIKELS